jgi:protein transport protein DSL1/ZW10
MQLYYGARDVLDLFRAVMPVLHANELETVPALAAVFANDCLYIAHHCMTLGYQFHVRGARGARVRAHAHTHAHT